jgi:hypothetical protein
MAGPDLPKGEGERREAAVRRRRIVVIGALFAAGLVTGFYAGFREGAALAGADGTWPPAMALALTALYLVALVGGTLVLNGVMDEHERQRTYKAASFASSVLVSIYPVWFLLWKGGFVVEPIHWVMYIIFMLGLGLAMLWYRFR